MRILLEEEKKGKTLNSQNVSKSIKESKIEFFSKTINRITSDNCRLEIGLRLTVKRKID